jgi:hypothetical protein
VAKPVARKSTKVGAGTVIMAASVVENTHGSAAAAAPAIAKWIAVSLDRRATSREP